MKRFAVFLNLFFISLNISAQSLQSPSDFLGYPLGSKFTYHHRVIDYFRYVATQKSQQVKIIEYGSTNEGRPLLLAIVASEENLKNIEEIRQNNLKNIGLLAGNATNKGPAIAWLSYNVHGNEAVSSEAAMQVLFEVLGNSPAFLKNTILIIDPCLNPDGHERYTQWYNRVANQIPAYNLMALEHNEPWPTGRFNHYLFDLNRDWAWQTQVESQKRMAVYNQWMPHLHADFHEMGYNESYYMPPSAKPYHEDITPYQRNFQEYLGEVNRKIFDKNHWLYFTKENYDLLYPSYGDTYPTYNGAIGMTYEQGGSGRAGIGLARDKYNDTLTLKERIIHHVATSLSTIDALTTKADKTIEEFTKFFDAKNSTAKYNTYVMKNIPANQALATLLDRLQIRYSYVNTGTLAMGYNYISQKDENVQVEKNDLLISTKQPKHKLVKILFEPRTTLEDSLTYDITAWSLPLVYNLKAFAFRDDLSLSTTETLIKPTTIIRKDSLPPPYAYLVRWRSFEAVRFLSSILTKNIKVSVAEKPFSIENNNYDAGTLIISRAANKNIGIAFDKILKESSLDNQIQATAISSGMVSSGLDLGSNSVFPIQKKNVCLLSGEGIDPTAIGEVWHFFEQGIKYPISVVGADYFNKIDLSKIDILILPDGKYAKILTNFDNIKRWIQMGGKLIAMEGAANFLADKEFALKHKYLDSLGNENLMPYKNLKLYANKMREDISNEVSGAIYKVNLDKTHPLAFGYDDNYVALLQKAYNFDFMHNAWNVGVLKENNLLAGFVGANTKLKLSNTLIHGVQDYGQGQIIYIADNPLYRSFWYGGKLLFANAIFMVN